MRFRGRVLSAGIGAVAVVALAIGGGGGATSESRGPNAVAVPPGPWHVVTTTDVDRTRLQVTKLGKVQLVADGTTLKTLMKGSCGVANLKTWWSGYSGSGDSYLEYHNTSWNVPGSCGDPYGNFQLQFNSNNGHLSVWFTQSNDETIPQSLDTNGVNTSKVKLGYPCPSGPDWGYHTIVTAPWGTDQILAGC